MTQALTLTLMGMTIVFLVLSIIYASVVFLGWAEARFAPPAATAPAGAGSAVSRAAPLAAGITEEELAVIHAALSHHLNLPSENFQINIHESNKES